eukprot:265268-Chlamydomonas_euryale.AAC.1
MSARPSHTPAAFCSAPWTACSGTTATAWSCTSTLAARGALQQKWTYRCRRRGTPRCCMSSHQEGKVCRAHTSAATAQAGASQQRQQQQQKQEHHNSGSSNSCGNISSSNNGALFLLNPALSTHHP